MEKLETLGAFLLLGISPNDVTETSKYHTDGDEADSDSKYSDIDTDSDNDELDNFFYLRMMSKLMQMLLHTYLIQV